MSAPLELFHRLGDPASARVRRRIVERGREAEIGFRNVHFASHQEAFAARGGTQIPALWDGARLHQGEEACLALLG